MGIVAGGWQMARAGLAAQKKLSEDQNFYEAKIATAVGVMALSEEQFLAA
jgi:hypothetical protein